MEQRQGLHDVEQGQPRGQAAPQRTGGSSCEVGVRTWNMGITVQLTGAEAMSVGEEGRQTCLAHTVENIGF